MSIKRPFSRSKGDDDDTIQIDDESGYQWWADRDALDTPINRRWRRPSPGGRYPFRRTSDRDGVEPGASHDDARRASPLFAPPAPDVPDPVDDWDRDSLFRRRERAAAAHQGAGRTVPTVDTGPETATHAPMPTATPTPWDVLGLTSNATWTEVVARHRELAKSHHPDRHSDGDEQDRRAAESTMAAINAAFQDLGQVYRLTDDR